MIWPGRKEYTLAKLQVAHYLRTQQSPNRPRWYETQRKTTHVVFWA